MTWRRRIYRLWPSWRRRDNELTQRLLVSSMRSRFENDPNYSWMTDEQFLARLIEGYRWSDSLTNADIHYRGHGRTA